MNLEIVRVQPETVMEFVRSTEREALKTFYDFSVIWHEERYAFSAQDGETIVGVAEILVAASLAHVERIIVLPQARLQGAGRALLAAASDTANYYNCHKMSAMVPAQSAAQKFFERCGYKQEALLPQHTFKLDISVLRKFLL